MLWSGCCLASYLKRYEDISGGWLLLTQSKCSVQSSCLVPKEQITVKGNHVPQSPHNSRLIGRPGWVIAFHHCCCSSAQDRSCSRNKVRWLYKYRTEEFFLVLFCFYYGFLVIVIFGYSFKLKVDLKERKKKTIYIWLLFTKIWN